MSRAQVRSILGSPLITDAFHDNRWDYVYRLQKGSSGEVESRKFSTFFDENDKLVRVAGDVSAAQTNDAAATTSSRLREIDLGSIDADAPPLAKEEKGLFGRMMESIGF